MFSGNIFWGTFNLDVAKQSMKKKCSLHSKKALEDNMTSPINKCVKLKSKLQLKRSVFLKYVIYLGVSTTVYVNCVDQG